MNKQPYALFVHAIRYYRLNLRLFEFLFFIKNKARIPRL